MLQKLFLVLLLCFVSELQTNQTKKPFFLKLTPEQIMQTFDGVMSDDYIKVLAKDFATKAAAHFMKEIRNQKKALVTKFKNNERVHDTYSKPARAPMEKVSQMVDVASEAANEAVKSELDENEALRLIQTPSPDGDHLDSSGELSDDQKKIPVIQVTKINGIYYRRLLGMI